MDWKKRLVFLACLLPFIWLMGRLALGDLGANPYEAITRFLGDWTLRLFLITLAITPVNRLFPGLARLRRMLGLFTFAYALLHVGSYIALDKTFELGEIGRDIMKRSFITVGMAALAMLIPLAITSTDKMAKRLGGKRWKRLHRLVWPASFLACLHFAMMVKAKAWTEPAIYTLILVLLLCLRLVRKRAPRAQSESGAPRPT
jgi:sulfoxide reductase heme-binding subunit YedZ